MGDSIFEKYPSNKRLYISRNSTFNSGWPNNSCVFGIAHYKDPLPFIDTIPSDIKGFYAYFGEGNYFILQNLIYKGINQNLERLTVGFEHSNAKYGYKDYARLSELLATAQFPKLKSFEYGCDFLLVNEEQSYPHLGDLTMVLNNMPNIETLDISGSFALENKVSLKNVKEVFIMDYYTETANGVVSTKTFDFLMDSDFGPLEKFEISMEANKEATYRFNEEILLKNIDSLKCVAIDGKYEKGTKYKLFNLLNTKVEKLFLDGIIEE